MSKIYQQVFLPCSRGLIKSSPSSLIPDGAVQEALNVRFGDGYVEKVHAFSKMTELPDKILRIYVFKTTDGNNLNMIHTNKGVYCIRENETEHTNLMKDSSYEVPEVGHVSSVDFFNNYYFCSIGNDIYYWDSVSDSCQVLEGTFDPDVWTASKEYKVGDCVKPSTYNGYIYKCTLAGTSGTEEPTWVTDMSTSIADGTCHWEGAGSLELEGSSAVHMRAQYVEIYKGFFFVANTEEDGESYPSRVRWSQWQNPRLWHNNDDGSGLAGYVDVNDTNGRILAIKKLGDVLYVYKEHSIVAITYTGDESTTFSKELVTTEAGLIGPDAIVALPHEHVFVGKNNIYVFDGNTVTPIGDAIKDWFFQRLKPTQADKIFGYYNEDSGDIVFSFDSTLSSETNRDMAITYNTTTHTWSTREMYMTAIGQYNQTQDRVIDQINVPMDEMPNTMIDASIYLKDKIVTIMGDENGNLYRLEGYADSRRDYDGYVITKTHHMDDPGHLKRLLRIQFHIETEGNYPLVVQVGYGWNAESTMTWTDKMEMSLAKPIPNYPNNGEAWRSQHIAPYVDVDITARYFQVRFGTPENSQPFKILGYTLYYQTRSDE